MLYLNTLKNDNNNPISDIANTHHLYAGCDKHITIMLFTVFIVLLQNCECYGG